MKTLLIILLAAGVAKAQTSPLTFYQNCFGGVDDYHDSARIDNCDFQDARNVLTYRGYLEKRPGSVLVPSPGIVVGYPLSFMKEFVNVSNNDYLLAQASTTIYSGNFGVPFVAIATVNVNGVTDSVTAFGKHFFVNGYDAPWYTTGFDYVLASTEMPTCSLIAFANERIYCANTPGQESTVFTSAFGDYTNWTIPFQLTADAPISFAFDEQDGQDISCLFASPYGMLVWKRTKTFLVKGVDNDDFYKVPLSPNVGCVDQRSVQNVEGNITWLGQDGVYQWSGGNAAPTLISRPIDNTIKQIRQITATSNRRTITTPEDWKAGIFSVNGSTTGWDPNTSPGSIVPSSWSVTDTDGSDWSSGAMTNLDTTTLDGSLILAAGANHVIDDFSSGNYSSWNCVDTFTTPLWKCGAGGVSAASHSLVIMNEGEYQTVSLSKARGTQFPMGSSSVSLQVKLGYYASGNGYADYYFVGDTYYQPVNGDFVRIHCVNAGGILATCDGAIYTKNISTLVMLSTGAITAISGGALGIAETGASCTDLTVQTSSMGVITVQSPACHLSMIATDPELPLKNNAYVLLSMTHIPDDGASYVTVVFDTVAQQGFQSSGSYTSPWFDTLFSTSVGSALQFDTEIPLGSTIAFSFRQSEQVGHGDAGPWVYTSTTTSGAWRIPFTQEYYQYKADFSTSYSTQTPILDDIQLAALSTGTWDSAVLFLGTKLTSWGQFGIQSELSDNTSVNYFVRSGTYAFAQTSTSIPWVAQPNNLNIAVSTADYIQVRAVSTVTTTPLMTISSDTISLDAITINWHEGSVGRVASLYFDKNYFLSVSLSTASAGNDTTLVLQRTGKWTIFSGPSWGVLSLYNFLPYSGSGLSDGAISRIMVDGTYDDAGSTISAYATTKDFQFDNQNGWKVFRQLYLESAPVFGGGTLTTTYSMDKSTNTVSSSLAIPAGTSFNDESKSAFPLGFAKGHYARFTFSNARLDEYFKLDAYTLLGNYENLYRK